MNKFKANSVIYEMEDGTKVSMSLSMIQLYTLKSKNKAAYESISRLLTKGPSEVIEIGELLYGAYLCANLDNPAPLAFTDFLEGMNPSFEANAHYVEQLVKSKKK